MLQNNLKIAWRSLTRHKLYSLINVLGLGFGIGCFLLIALFAVDEMTFDKFHKNADHIYRVVQHRETPDGGEQHFGAVSYNIASSARTEIPGVEYSNRMLMWGRAVLRNPENQRGFYQPFLTSENSMFQIFDFPFVAGDPKTALAEPNTVVLSEEMARRFFIDENPIGKILRSDRGMDLQVTGVFKNIPTNSHLQFESLVSHATIEAQPWFDEDVTGEWASQNWGTYLCLTPGTDPGPIGKQLTAFAETRAQQDRPFTGQLTLQPLSDIHFGSADIQRELNENKSTYTYLYIFGLIGLFILGIACINYINLATARSSKYSREVGVRKVVGAEVGQLFSRFMSESFLLTLLAFVLAVGLVQVAMPWFNEFTGKTLTLHPAASGWTFPILLSVVLLVSLAAGSYPSVYLSRFRPSVVLKGKDNGKKGQRGYLRQGLVVLQFSLSILMIIGTMVAWQQMNFVQNQDLGFNQEQMIVVDINSGQVRNGFETIRNGYSQLPAVQSVAVSSRVPGEWKQLLQTEVRPPGKFAERGPTPWFIGADEYFLETFEIELINGRNFDPTRLADSAAVILNEQAATAMGIKEANEQEVLIVSRINNGSERVFDEPFRAKVIGITKDFNFQSLYEPIAPLVLGNWNNPIQSIDYFTARISPENVEATIAQMTDILHAVDPEQIFEYHFLDDQIANFYEADNRRSQLFTIAALCAIFIACLGLFGLAAFMAEQRTKEIGIRKVLGASTSGIVGLLSKDFLKLVLIALVIASPLGYYFMGEWLQDFAYHIKVQWWVFVLAGSLAMLVAFLTVSFQSIKAALANPVNSLRSE
ncbi:MAG: ABC transporter permease [Bacteroidota bacterium]